MKQINIYEPKAPLFEQPIVVKNRKCKICSIGFSWRTTDYQHGTNPDNGACGSCQFWVEKFMLRNSPNVARIAGQHYILGNEITDIELKPNDSIDSIAKRIWKKPGETLGMGGSVSVIIFDDGRVSVTNDLWHQGQIPETWGEWLPDNAKFMERGL